MQSISSITLITLAAGLASSVLHAQPLTPASRADARVERDPPPQTAAPRGLILLGFGAMRDELENYPVDTSIGGTGVFAPPTSTVLPDGFDWGLNNLRGQTSTNFVRVVDLSGSPVGGNATQALRIRTSSAQNPGLFFLGASLRWDTPVTPSPDHNARVSAEMYISTIAEQYTFEPISGVTGFIAGRLLWGGTCTNSDPTYCAELGLPDGPVPTIHSLYDNGNWATGAFYPVRFCTTMSNQPIAGCTPPPGFAIGDPVPPPIGAWVRFAAEATPDNRMTYSIDYFNGQPEVAIASQQAITSARIDRVGWNTSFESQDAFMLVDNIEASGDIFVPTPPPPLDCPYLDDLVWMDGGPLANQSPRWFAAPTSAAVVVQDGARRVISQVNNVSPDNYHRREFSTELPHENATLANDLVVSFEARFTLSTVRAFALFDGPDLVARVFRGHEDRTDPTKLGFTNSVFVQTDADFNPIDDPSGDPDAVNPVIGQHIVDTGVEIPNWQYRTITLRLSASGAMRVYVDNSLAYAGPAAFGSGVNTLAFESENNLFGPGGTLRVGNIALACDAPSCATDFDFDDLTSFSDLNAVLSNFGATGLTGFHPGDANADGVVNFADLNAVLAAFGTSCK